MHVDGNAAAGLLTQVFARDMTGAHGTCGSCGHNGPLAEAVVYGEAAGTVFRCPTCDNVLMTLVEAPGRILARLAGLRWLAVPI
ncbi:DUF6510 family protein [Nonomuraea soli]|uniref:Putative RNA-binding Zn-ribbon protein involved in translation (DUF1610 family) n=1 Tax=Nonomuraea soli TaxID=1032476 RepID=A0A7W0CJS5_9ACTN|nr:DUF6510 family protein [Nonomuraea soli]MBA2892453.1 putative RNA-binding Zn-ribbon protein involved in translation (DUF1610 family) [Nonomuraea soli]